MWAARGEGFRHTPYSSKGANRTGIKGTAKSKGHDHPYGGKGRAQGQREDWHLRISKRLDWHLTIAKRLCHIGRRAPLVPVRSIMSVADLEVCLNIDAQNIIEAVDHHMFKDDESRRFEKFTDDESGTYIEVMPSRRLTYNSKGANRSGIKGAAKGRDHDHPYGGKGQAQGQRVGLHLWISKRVCHIGRRAPSVSSHSSGSKRRSWGSRCCSAIASAPRSAGGSAVRLLSGRVAAQGVA